MNNTILSYLAFLPVVGIGGILLITLLREIQRRKNIEQEAVERGWRYEDTSRLGFPSYRFSGMASGNVTWTAECVTSSSGDETSSTTYQTRWSSQAITLPDRLVLIGPRMHIVGALPATLRGGRLGSTLVRTFLGQIFGDDADRLGGMTEATIGSDAFRRRYMVYVHDASDASRLLGMGVESALLDWPKRQSVAIKLGGNELSLWLPGLEITQIEQVEQIVTLGVRVVTAWRSIT